MLRHLIRIILLLSLTQVALSETITMAFGEKIPPYCFPETNSGIELDIISEALAYRGHTLKPEYYPLGRIPVAFRQQRVDAAMTDLGEDLTSSGGFYGEPAVLYYNAFITLTKNQLTITQPGDLKDLSIISFQGADKRFPEWLSQVKVGKNYSEKNDQNTQVAMLQSGRKDVVLSDIYIYRYFENQAYKNTGLKPLAVTVHDVIALNPQDYRPVFRSKKIRDDFNAGLQHMKNSGRIQQIYDHYISH